LAAKDRRERKDGGGRIGRKKAQEAQDGARLRRSISFAIFAFFRTFFDESRGLVTAFHFRRRVTLRGGRRRADAVGFISPRRWKNVSMALCVSDQFVAAMVRSSRSMFNRSGCDRPS
jgi:hypothetical protein